MPENLLKGLSSDTSTDRDISIVSIIGLLNISGDQLKEVKGKPAIGRNFEVETIANKSGLVTITLCRKDGARLSLDQELPENYHFCEDQEFCFRKKKKVIGFPAQEVPYRNFVLSLAHEIGHAWLPSPINFTEREKIRAFWETEYRASKHNLRTIPVRLGGVISGLKRADIAPVHRPIWYVDRLHKHYISLECAVWNDTFRILSGLENDGWKVLAGYENKREIADFVHAMLFTYIIDWRIDRFKAGDLDAVLHIGDDKDDIGQFCTQALTAAFEKYP